MNKPTTKIARPANTEDNAKRLALHAKCDVRTARAWLAGGKTHGFELEDRIAKAVEKMAAEDAATKTKPSRKRGTK